MTTEPLFLLAPMDGMTHASFRAICFGYGADGATTEMILSHAFGRARRRMSDKFLETLVRLPGEGPLAAQLIGSDPGLMAEAARRISALGRFDAIEINLGCPARKVVGSGNGSALMRTPGLARDIMAAVRDATDLPVRLKMRMGWDAEHITAPELALAAQALGFEAITLHGRTRMQMYSGPVDAAGIRAVAEAVDIPVYANGGVTSANDALAFLDATHAAGVAIGRAALKRPWIFDDIRRLRRGEPVGERDARERVGLLVRLAEMACLHRPEPVAVCEMRKFSRWLLPGLTGAEALLEALNAVTTLDGYRAAMLGYLERLEKAGDLLPHPELAPPQTLDTVRPDTGPRLNRDKGLSAP